MRMIDRAFALTKCFDEGIENIALVIAPNWDTAVQYIIDRPEQFESFLFFLKHPRTIDEFMTAMGNSWVDGDSKPEIRLNQIETVYQA